VRQRQGSVVLDKRSKTWNFFFWDDGKRHSKKIGTMSQYPTKAAAWRAAKPLRDAVENRERARLISAPTVQRLADLYRVEKMPTRADTRRAYEVWLRHHILPKLGDLPYH